MFLSRPLHGRGGRTTFKDCPINHSPTHPPTHPPTHKVIFTMLPATAHVQQVGGWVDGSVSPFIHSLIHSFIHSFIHLMRFIHSHPQVLGEVLIPQAREGTLLVDGSTIDPVASKALAVQAVERGLEMVDAPVSGGVGGAEGEEVFGWVGEVFFLWVAFGCVWLSTLPVCMYVFTSPPSSSPISPTHPPTPLSSGHAHLHGRGQAGQCGESHPPPPAIHG